MDSELDKSLTHDALLDLAGERYFERGEGYHRGGHVYSLVEYDGVIVAKVAGTDEYRVRLWAEDGLAYTCDCPLGVDGAFCKHCVAAGLAWLEGDFSEDAPGGSVTMDDVRAYLEEQDKDLLVRIVIQQAMEDEGLRERLLLRASRMGGLDLAAFRRAIDDAVGFGEDYYGPPWDYARGIQNVVGAIAELLEDGFASEVIGLSEYALASVESFKLRCGRYDRRHSRSSGGTPPRSLRTGEAGPGGAGEPALRVGAGRRPRRLLRRGEHLR